MEERMNIIKTPHFKPRPLMAVVILLLLGGASFTLVTFLINFAQLQEADDAPGGGPGRVSAAASSTAPVPPAWFTPLWRQRRAAISAAVLQTLAAAQAPPWLGQLNH